MYTVFEYFYAYISSKYGLLITYYPDDLLKNNYYRYKACSRIFD